MEARGSKSEAPCLESQLVRGREALVTAEPELSLTHMYGFPRFYSILKTLSN